jgi:hypothetical protein
MNRSIMAGAVALTTLAIGLTLNGCGDTEPAEGGDAKPAATPEGDAAKAKADAEAALKPTKDCLPGEPKDTLVMAQAWFTKVAGRPKPGPARLLLWQKDPDGNYKSHKLEDEGSNVFHKAVFTDQGLVTIGAQKASLKRWTKGADGCFKAETLWEKSWGGKFDRLRDIEFADVDHDGEDEWIIATHDYGVVAVYNPPTEPGGKPEVIELDKKADTFVHEIEVGDIDGDGKAEFFATPSDRNKAGTSQAGEIVMYRWDGATYQRTKIDGDEHTHAKEILAVDIDGDGKTEFFSVLEAELENRQIKEPVKVRLYSPNDDGTFAHEDVVTINDQQTRFIVAGDFDGDGRQELVAAAYKTGLYFIDSEVKGDETTWTITNFDAVSSGFEHASIVHDLDGDGTPELYVAADDQQEFKRYTWNAETKTFDKTLIGRYDDDTFTWFVAAGKL